MKIFKRTSILLLFVLLAFGILYFNKIKKVYQAIHLFDEDKIVNNFLNMDEFTSHKVVEKSANPFIFPKGKTIELPKSFEYDGQTFQTKKYLDSSATTGLLVLQNDQLVFEEYYLGHQQDNQHISWSVAKSFVSAMLGIAYDRGLIKNLDSKIDEYLPELKGSGYEGVKIKDILQMSSGVKFNEDYFDQFSDINRYGRTFAWGASQNNFATTLVNEKPPGTYNHYVSIDTHVIGMLLVKITGQSITDFMKENLWDKIGGEFDAYWLNDDTGMEMALGGLNVCLRDYAKLGTLFLHKGNWQGNQIVSEEWVKMSTTPDAPHLIPGKNNPNSAHDMGYGFQWWIPEGNEGEFLARGIYNQFIYINPTTQTVIVKNSANRNFRDGENPYGMIHTVMELFRDIAHQNQKLEQPVEEIE